MNICQISCAQGAGAADLDLRPIAPSESNEENAAGDRPYDSKKPVPKKLQMNNVILTCPFNWGQVPQRGES
ncbi:MAG: hypothetical protein F6K30_03095 [Cyanothece sp. SIO2G6]|nr:hypothetical protein [Cyanothece sp. SIO2G6]